MRNPFKKQYWSEITVVNEETLEELSVDIEVLLTALFKEIEQLSIQIKSLRDDVDDLTDFVEDNLD